MLPIGVSYELGLDARHGLTRKRGRVLVQGLVGFRAAMSLV